MIAAGVCTSSSYRSVDISISHALYAHTNEALPCDAKELNIKLTGELKPCYGYSSVNGLEKAVPSSTYSRAIVNLKRVFVGSVWSKDSPLC